MNETQGTEILPHIAKAIEIAGGPAVLARKLSVTTQAVCFWRDGKRKFPEALGARLESATGGVVTRRHLWPTTFHDIWPELAAVQSPQAEAAHG